MKKVFIFLTVLLLAVSPMIFAGGGSQASPSRTAVEVSAPGVLPITKEKVTLDVLWNLEPYYTDLLTNSHIIEFEALTNVHANFIQVASEGFGERLNLLLNSGEYPEVIISTGFASASDLVRYGTMEKILIPLNSLIEEQAPNIKAYYAKYPWVKEAITSPDGNMYAIPTIDSGAKSLNHVSISYKLWLNTEWLNKLGLSKPTTTEEFRTVLRAFKTRDPNGNGRADEIPLTGAQGTWAADPWYYLLNAFGYYDDTLVALRNNTFTPTANQDYIRDGLAYIKSLYDEGLIDPAAFTQTLEQMTAVGNNPGTVIMGAAVCGHIQMAVDINNVERSKVYTVLEPLTGPSGYRGIPFAGDERKSSSGSFAITDKCINPAVAIKWADAHNTNYWSLRQNVGKKGVHWDDADPGTFGMDGITPAQYKYAPDFYETVNISNNDKLGSAFRLLEEDWNNLFAVTGDINEPSNYVGRLYRETLKLVPYAADVQIIPPLAYDENTSVRMSQISAPLSDFVKSSFVEFITGRKNLTSDWNTYKQGLEQLGYSEYVRNMQTAYNAIKK
ncbi:MAG: extracellular solute-binding protein [Treponema sp.]|jgi:putative aldouronate transport system substrate-binding protein|nr:extracellular solute-binding protein [Treponema sp.]